MRLVRSGLVAGVSLLVSLLSLGCPKATPEPTDAAAGALAADGGGESEGGGGGEGGAGTTDPYPIEPNGAAVPLAEKLCDVLTALPERKRAACCNATPAVGITARCTFQLSAALRHDALELDEKDVDACVAAFEKTLEGCDWVGSFVPGPPPACQGVFKGKRAAGQTCRSSLECASDLRCKDFSPTTAVGKCGPAGVSDEASCGGVVDSLATSTRQLDLDKRHPECKERCVRRKCQAPLREGEACLTTGECKDGTQCMAPPGAAPPKHGYLPPKQCVALALPAKEGAPCPAGACTAPLQCIRGKCAAKKGAGAACSEELECRGGCLKDGGTQGICGPRCESH